MATKTRKTGTPRRSAIEAAPPALEAARAEVQQAIEAAAETPAKTADFMSDAVDTVQHRTAETIEAATDTVETAHDATLEVVETATETTEHAADTAASATETVANTVQEDVKTMASKFETTANTFADKAQGAMQKSGQYAADFADFGKGNIEAMVESTRIAAKGAEEIFKYSTDYGRQTIEKANETAKRFASVKSPVEFFQLQTEVSKSFVEACVAEGSKFTENYLKLVSESVQPLSNRFAIAADKVKAAA